jgi:hypothetical protein
MKQEILSGSGCLLLTVPTYSDFVCLYKPTGLVADFCLHFAVAQYWRLADAGIRQWKMQVFGQGWPTCSPSGKYLQSSLA